MTVAKTKLQQLAIKGAKLQLAKPHDIAAANAVFSEMEKLPISAFASELVTMPTADAMRVLRWGSLEIGYDRQNKFGREVFLNWAEHAANLLADPVTFGQAFPGESLDG